MSDIRAWSFFVLTVLLTLILNIAPMPFSGPAWLYYIEPDWIVLGWFFWVMYQQERCSLLLAFIAGLCVDVLANEPLGLNSLLLLTLIFVGRQALPFVRQKIAFRSSATLLLLCFILTSAKAVFLLVTLDINIHLVQLFMTPTATLAWWQLLVPLLRSEHSQFRDSVQ